MRHMNKHVVILHECQRVSTSTHLMSHFDVIFPTSTSLILFSHFCSDSNIFLSPFKCCFPQCMSYICNESVAWTTLSRTLLISFSGVPKNLGWFGVRILTCPARDLGSISGQCTVLVSGDLFWSLSWEMERTQNAGTLPPQNSLPNAASSFLYSPKHTSVSEILMGY